MKERDFRLEFIRGFSMLIIVIYHYSCALDLKFITGPFRPFWHFASGNWGSAFVVVFFMISGYVLMVQYHDSLDLKKFYLKRWISIFPMFYMAWGSMYVVRAIQHKNLLWGGRPILLILSLLGLDGYFSSKIENYYSVGEWFLGAIILLYILFPLLRVLYVRWKVGLTILYILLFFSLECLKIMDYCKRSDLFFCTFSVWMGMLFWDYREKIRNYLVMAAATLICVYLYLIDVTSYLSSIMICHMFGIAAFLILYNMPVEKIKNNNIIKNSILFFSRVSYSVMLVHHVLIYWGIRGCQIIGLNLNIGFFLIMIVIYLTAFLFYNISQKVLTVLRRLTGIQTTAL